MTLRGIALLCAFLPGPAAAQPFETVGTRASGMGGAFVAVADDASAAYWNPAGFAAGTYFSLAIDRTGATVDPDGAAGGGNQSGFLIALGAPPVGLSYYRLRSTSLIPRPIPTGAAAAGRNLTAAAEVSLRTLVTHHTGVTVLQSIAPGVAVGATLKLVRGIASSSIEPDGDRDALLEEAGALLGKGSTRFDADFGVMATRGPFKAGLTVRNVSEPHFSAAGTGAERLVLERQARAGVSLVPLPGWVVAADFDLTTATGPAGDVRQFAAGTEGRIARKAFVRGGLQVNTTGDAAPAVSLGGSYAATGSLLVDVQVTAGSDRAPRGWGLAARIVF